jgi:Sugar (and other) transporter
VGFVGRTTGNLCRDSQLFQHLWRPFQSLLLGSIWTTNNLCCGGCCIHCRIVVSSIRAQLHLANDRASTRWTRRWRGPSGKYTIAITLPNKQALRANPQRSRLPSLLTRSNIQIDPVYISEISPAKHRGELVTWSEIGINVGIVLGFVMGLVFSGFNDAVEWRALFIMGAILPVLMIYLALKVMPESPRWYVLKFRYDEARSVLYSIYPPGYNVDLVIDDIKESLERERLAETTLGWWTIFHPTPAFRRMLTVGLGIAAAQQFVGIDAIQYYLLDIMESATDSELTQQILLILLGCIKLVCIVIAGKFFDYRGRRPLVFMSLIGKLAMGGRLARLSSVFMTYQCLVINVSYCCRACLQA